MPPESIWDTYLRQKETMEDIVYPSHAPPFERTLEQEVFDISFEHMMLRHSQFRGSRELADVWQLHRAADGRWSMRLWRSLTRERDKVIEDRTAAEEAVLEVDGLEEELGAEGHPEALIHEYLRLRQAIVQGWVPLEEELVQFAERSLQRCLEFFRRFPGLRPGLTFEATRAPDFEPQRVFAPPSHATDDEVERSRREVELARQRREELEAELEAEADPDGPGPTLH
ncbi:MAG TPA: hypothetical protein P5076_03735 [Myxococcota bacterium]|nr:hypothetical protein [Myxococcota bacterium]